MNDDEKVKEIGRKFGISVTIEDLKNNSQINLEKQYDVDAISTKLEK